MKIINMASFPPPIGGVSYFLKRLKSYTDDIDSQNVYEYVDVSGIDIENKKKNGIICLKKIQVPFFLLRHKKAYIVFHSNSVAHLVLHWLFARKHRFIYFTHGESIIKRQNYLGWRNRILKKAEGFVTPTKELYEKVYEMFGDVCEVKYIPFIIYPRNIEPLEILEIKQLKIRTDFIFSVYANSLILFKDDDLYGIDMVIDLSYRLKQKGYKVGFIVLIIDITDKNKYGSYLKKIEKYGLKEEVKIIHNQLEEASSLYLATNAYLRPTNTDGDSFSIWEALHFGIPVLTSDVTQRPEGCVLFKNRDVEDLTEKAIYLIENYGAIKTAVNSKVIKGNERIITEYLQSMSEMTKD